MARLAAAWHLGVAVLGLSLTACAQDGARLWSTGATGGVSATAAGGPAPAMVQVAGAGRPRQHRVQAGETLSQLAERYGLGLSVLAAANGLPVTAKVQVGRQLVIPAPAPGATAEAAAYTVKPGETMAGIAARQGVKLSDLVAVNPGLNPDRVRPGQRLRLPGEVAMPAAPTMTAEEIEAVRQASQAKPPSLSGEGFLWPVRGRVVSTFGEKPDGSRNDGINIAAPSGTAVLAAENGVVVYAGGRLPGFGQTLLVRHANGFTTAYAHNRSLLVKVGDEVTRGQRIAILGSLSGLPQAQLHFELRMGRTPLDPARHLAALGGAAEIASSG